MKPELVTQTAIASRKRAAVKTLCYRLLMVSITVVIAFLIVGDGWEALHIGLATNVLKSGTYYAYERLWSHVEWGISHVG